MVKRWLATDKTLKSYGQNTHKLDPNVKKRVAGNTTSELGLLLGGTIRFKHSWPDHRRVPLLA